MQISNSTPVISIYLRGLSTVNEEGESVSGNSAFELQSNSTIDIDSVSIVSLAEEASGTNYLINLQQILLTPPIFLGKVTALL